MQKITKEDLGTDSEDRFHLPRAQQYRFVELIRNGHGLHLRAALVIEKAAQTLPEQVSIFVERGFLTPHLKVASGRSVIDMTLLEVRNLEHITIRLLGEVPEDMQIKIRDAVRQAAVTTY